MNEQTVQDYLPFPDNTFDMVFSHSVLHHVPEIRQAEKETRRALCPGGEKPADTSTPAEGFQAIPDRAES